MDFKDLNDDELHFLIKRYSNFLRDLKRELKRRSSIREYDEISSYDSSAEIKMLAINLLNHLGFTKNKCYRMEIASITNALYKNDEWKERHSHYSNEELATVVVLEVMNHYNVDVDKNDVVSFYGCDEKKVDKLYMRVHNFCVDRYWKDIKR